MARHPAHPRGGRRCESRANPAQGWRINETSVAAKRGHSARFSNGNPCDSRGLPEPDDGVFRSFHDHKCYNWL